MYSRHKTLTLNLPNPTSEEKYTLIVSSDFDSGNLELAKVSALPSFQLAFSKNSKHPYGLVVTPALQPFNSNYSHKVSTKNFFHFSVRLKTTSEHQRDEGQNSFNGKSSNQDNKLKTMTQEEQLQSLQDRKTQQKQGRKVKIQICINRMKILQYFLNTVNNNQNLNAFNQFYNICTYRRPVSNESSLNREYDPYEYVKQRPQQMKINVSSLYNDETQIDMSFLYQLDSEYEIFFAYHYPYPLQKIHKLLSLLPGKIETINSQNQTINQQLNKLGTLQNKSEEPLKKTSSAEKVESLFSGNSKNDKAQYIYYRNEVLAQSIEKRSMNLLTLTSVNSQLLSQSKGNQSINDIVIGSKRYCLSYELQPSLSTNMFPLADNVCRPYQFSDKPYIFLTCRVHPGQTSASFVLQGLIEYLTSGQFGQNGQGTNNNVGDLLRLFVFVIVPVINPDGVYHGCYRMDTMGHNLNRFYSTAVANKQQISLYFRPTIFAIQNIFTSYSNRIMTYIDFHSHPHPNKGAFFYGNSFNTLHDQVESQMFAKMLCRMTEQLFSYQQSCFSPQQMISKDINQIMSKQGCGRVFAFKTLAKNQSYTVPFCYTLEVGYHGMYDKKTQTKTIFTTQSYKQLGKRILDCILETHVFNLVLANRDNYQNSYINDGKITTLAQQSQILQIIQQKDQIARQIYTRQDRFKLVDQGVLKKVKTINSIIIKNIYLRFYIAFPSFHNALKKIVLQRGSHFFGEELNQKLQMKLLKVQKEKPRAGDVKEVQSSRLYKKIQRKEVGDLPKLIQKEFTNYKMAFPKIQLRQLKAEWVNEDLLFNQAIKQAQESQLTCFKSKGKSVPINNKSNGPFRNRESDLSNNKNALSALPTTINDRMRKQGTTSRSDQFNDYTFRDGINNQRSYNLANDEENGSQQYCRQLKFNYKKSHHSQTKGVPASYRKYFHRFQRQLAMQKQIQSFQQGVDCEQRNSSDQQLDGSDDQLLQRKSIAAAKFNSRQGHRSSGRHHQTQLTDQYLLNSKEINKVQEQQREKLSKLFIQNISQRLTKQKDLHSKKIEQKSKASEEFSKPFEGDYERKQSQLSQQFSDITEMQYQVQLGQKIQQHDPMNRLHPKMMFRYPKKDQKNHQFLSKRDAKQQQGRDQQKYCFHIRKGITEELVRSEDNSPSHPFRQHSSKQYQKQHAFKFSCNVSNNGGNQMQNRSHLSPDKVIVSQNGKQESFSLPKIGCRIQSVRRKFDVELKLKKRNDEKYKVEFSQLHKHAKGDVLNFIQGNHTNNNQVTVKIKKNGGLIVNKKK